jgi:hypothetical protein
MRSPKPLRTEFFTPVANTIFSKAYELGTALYYLLWCQARVTEEYDETIGNDQRRIGRVLGGMPCRDSDVQRDFPSISTWTIGEWRKKCAEADLIRVKRTPVGYGIEVLNSIKNLPSELGKTQDHKASELVKTPSRKQSDLVKNPSHPSGELVKTDGLILEKPISDLGKSQLHIEEKVEEKEEKKEKHLGSGSVASISSTPSGQEDWKTKFEEAVGTIATKRNVNLPPVPAWVFEEVEEHGQEAGNWMLAWIDDRAKRLDGKPGHIRIPSKYWEWMRPPFEKQFSAAEVR